MIVGWAAEHDGGGKECGYVWNDGHQRAIKRALSLGSHGNDDVILVPYMEGIWVGVVEGRWHVQRADSLHQSVLCQVLVHWAQQAVCGQTPKRDENSVLENKKIVK